MQQDIITHSESLELHRASKRKSITKRMRLNWDVYLIALPGLALLLVLNYIPMYGITIAFKDFNIFQGILGSDWCGLENFIRLIYSDEFKRSFVNTFTLSVLSLLWGMPFPIILSLLLNECRKLVFKRSIQTVTYIPHFISWVVMAGICIDILSPSSGIINKVIEALGGEAIFFMTDLKWIRTVVIGSQIWKETGWSAIIYLAAISGVDQQLYEAAAIDGAGRLRQTFHITLPAIRGTFIVLLILRLGGLMGSNFEQIFNLYNPTVYAKIDVISTYVYRTTFDTLDFGYTTAASLVSQVINCILLVLSNITIKRLGGRGLY